MSQREKLPEWKIERIRRVARENPDLSCELLAERFGINSATASHLCRGIPRDRFNLRKWYEKHRGGEIGFTNLPITRNW